MTTTSKSRTGGLL